ncbi:MAG: hypothetical protein MHM6MM_002204 [Cercozoa sp. M6MM]
MEQNVAALVAPTKQLLESLIELLPKEWPLRDGVLSVRTKYYAAEVRLLTYESLESSELESSQALLVAFDASEAPSLERLESLFKRDADTKLLVPLPCQTLEEQFPSDDWLLDRRVELLQPEPHVQCDDIANEYRERVRSALECVMWPEMQRATAKASRETTKASETEVAELCEALSGMQSDFADLENDDFGFDDAALAEAMSLVAQTREHIQSTSEGEQTPEARRDRHRRAAEATLALAKALGMADELGELQAAIEEMSSFSE